MIRTLNLSDRVLLSLIQAENVAINLGSFL